MIVGRTFDMSTPAAVFDLAEVSPNRREPIDRPDLGDYTHIRAYHSCRPKSVQAYMDYGLRIMPRSELERSFREAYNDFPEKELARAIREHPLDLARIDFCLDKKHMREMAAGHYGKYGSETIKELAVRLLKDGDTTQIERLANRGSPTMFTVEIPITQLNDEERGILNELFDELAEGSCDDPTDVTISVYEPVPGSCIVHHEIIPLTY